MSVTDSESNASPLSPRPPEQSSSVALMALRGKPFKPYKPHGPRLPAGRKEPTPEEREARRQRQRDASREWYRRNRESVLIKKQLERLAASVATQPNAIADGQCVDGPQ